MANVRQPNIGDWYKSINGDRFEIVALDDDEATLEIQHFDGAIEEIDFDTWSEMEIDAIEPPEDWSGSYDLSRDDYGVDLDRPAGDTHANPLDSSMKRTRNPIDPDCLTLFGLNTLPASPILRSKPVVLRIRIKSDNPSGLKFDDARPLQ